jgi:hypothetical protein
VDDAGDGFDNIPAGAEVEFSVSYTPHGADPPASELDRYRVIPDGYF